MGGSGARGCRVGLRGCSARGAAPRRAGSGSPCQLGGAALVPPRPAGAGRADPPRSPERSAPRRLELGASPPLCRALARSLRSARAPLGHLRRSGSRPRLPPSPAPGLSSTFPESLLPSLGRRWQRRRVPRLPNFGAHSRDERPSAPAAAQPAAAGRGRCGRRCRRSGPRLRALALPGARGGPGGGHLIPSANRPEPRAGAAPAGLLRRLQLGARPRDGLFHRGPEGKVPPGPPTLPAASPAPCSLAVAGLHVLTPGTALPAPQSSQDWSPALLRWYICLLSSFTPLPPVTVQGILYFSPRARAYS